MPSITYGRIEHPKYASYYKALLVGGPHGIFLELRKKLALTRGILLVDHREYKTNDFRKPLPKEIDFILILKDMISHSEHNVAMAMAKSYGILVIRTQRKWSTMASALANRGLHAASVDPDTIDFEERRAKIESQRIEESISILSDPTPIDPIRQQSPSAITIKVVGLADSTIEPNLVVVSLATHLLKRLSDSTFSEISITREGITIIALAQKD